MVAGRRSHPPRATDPRDQHLYRPARSPGAWGKGRSPFTCRARGSAGVPSQGYQLPPHAPPQLYRAGHRGHPMRIAARPMASPSTDLEEAQRQEVMVGPRHRQGDIRERPAGAGSSGRRSTRPVMEGMFLRSDLRRKPQQGGLADCSVFRGAIAVHRDHIEKYRDKEFPIDPVGPSRT